MARGDRSTTAHPRNVVHHASPDRDRQQAIPPWGGMNTTPARDPGNPHLSGRVARLRRLPAPPKKWKFPSGFACGAGVPQSHAALQFIPAGLARWRHLETTDERSFPVRLDHV